MDPTSPPPPPSSTPSPPPPPSERLNVADVYQTLSPSEIKELYDAHSLGFAVGCINLRGDINVGMMVRSAAIFGAQKFFMLGRRSYDKRSSVGTHHHIPVERVYCMHGPCSEELKDSKIIDILGKLQKNYTICFVEQSSHSVDLNHFSKEISPSLSLPPLFIFGSEGSGIPPNILFSLDNTYIIEIKQTSPLGRSLNVAVSCGIVLSNYMYNFLAVQ